eukprot:716652-Pelagomonas_calceolata.AAC.2
MLFAWQGRNFELEVSTEIARMQWNFQWAEKEAWTFCASKAHRQPSHLTSVEVCIEPLANPTGVLFSSIYHLPAWAFEPGWVLGIHQQQGDMLENLPGVVPVLGIWRITGSTRL